MRPSGIRDKAEARILATAERKIVSVTPEPETIVRLVEFSFLINPERE